MSQGTWDQSPVTTTTVTLSQCSGELHEPDFHISFLYGIVKLSWGLIYEFLKIWINFPLHRKILKWSIVEINPNKKTEKS